MSKLYHVNKINKKIGNY